MKDIHHNENVDVVEATLIKTVNKALQGYIDVRIV